MSGTRITIEEADLAGPKKSPDELLAAGWVCRDIRWLTGETWQALLTTMGKGNFSLLAMTERTFKDDPTRTMYFGGQFMISPAGMDGIRLRYTQVASEKPA